MNRGLPWTFHLNGISSLLNGDRSNLHDLNGHIRDDVSFIGVLDLPSHILGRKTRQMGIWHDHCRFRSGIEDGLGLPCSLVDLLCAIKEPGIVHRLVAWPGEEGTGDREKIWDLTRYAGIIAACPQGDDTTAFAVQHIISTISHIKAQVGHFPYTPWYGLLFPLAMAGSQAQHLGEVDKTLIIACITDIASGSLDQFPYYGNVVAALREFWQRGAGRSLEQVVVDLDMELGLF
jgi:hypothetical protein